MPVRFKLPIRSYSENDAVRANSLAPPRSNVTNFPPLPHFHCGPPTIPSATTISVETTANRPILRRGAVSSSYLMRDAMIAASAIDSYEFTRQETYSCDYLYSTACLDQKGDATLSPGKRNFAEQEEDDMTDVSTCYRSTCSTSSQRRRTDSGMWSDCDSSVSSMNTSTAHTESESTRIVKDLMEIEDRQSFLSIGQTQKQGFCEP
jgi:hypothetical protein